MQFYLGKLLTAVVISPLSWVLVAQGAAIFFARRNRPRAAVGAGAAAIFLLFLASAPLVQGLLRRPLENRFPARALADYPTADAIVVLGGSVVGLQPPRTEPEEDGGSRLVPAARLFRLGKAPRVIVSSGGPSYLASDGRQRYDADDMRDMLVDLGVPASAIVEETKSRNTVENARFSAEILKSHGWSRVLLVTSAYHIRRAARNFERAGVQFVPVPTAREVIDGPYSLSDLWPSPFAMASIFISLKEYVGYLAGR